MTATLLAIVGGLVLLIAGGELLVRGSVRVAERAGVSALLIGLTLVGFGTSVPELVTSVQAAAVGSPGIAVGNIVGSNLANVLLILGSSALICPLFVTGRALKRDGAFALAVTVLLAAVAVTVGLVRPVGIAFIVLLVGYLFYAWLQERDSTDDHTAAYDKASAVEAVDRSLLQRVAEPASGVAAWLVPLAIAVAGLTIIVFGARTLVGGAVELARLAGLSEEAIGLTIVAVGTSAPELATSLVAAYRRQAEVAIGNVLGSNVYNLLGIGGFTALIAPTAVPARIAGFDLPFLIAVSGLLLLFAWTGQRLNRVEGAVFLAVYTAYTGYLLAA